MQKPMIGITSGEILSPKYTEAVERAGGLPYVLLPDEIPESIPDKCSGIIFSGGGDIAPELFGLYDYDHSLVRGLDLRRDEFELRLAALAFERRIPALGICRGIQVMNAALGGTLILDIPGHMQTAARDKKTHSVVAVCPSRLGDILGSRIEVNSFHHQAVGRISPRLKLSAASVDGVIEGLEAPDFFFIGVQWHPECLSDEESERLFSALINAAK